MGSLGHWVLPLRRGPGDSLVALRSSPRRSSVVFGLESVGGELLQRWSHDLPFDWDHPTVVGHEDRAHVPGMATIGADRLFVSSGHRRLLLDMPSGSVIADVPDAEPPTSMPYHHQGRIAVAEGPSVAFYDATSGEPMRRRTIPGGRAVWTVGKSSACVARAHVRRLPSNRG